MYACNTGLTLISTDSEVLGNTVWVPVGFTVDIDQWSVLGSLVGSSSASHDDITGGSLFG